MSDIISRLRDAYLRNPAEALHMLPELFEAEENGLIEEFPCKIGVDVYAALDKVRTCVCIGWEKKGGTLYMLCMDRETGRHYSFFDFHFSGRITGRPTVFLTRSAAEQAIKEAEK